MLVAQRFLIKRAFNRFPFLFPASSFFFSSSSPHYMWWLFFCCWWWWRYDTILCSHLPTHHHNNTESKDEYWRITLNVGIVRIYIVERIVWDNTHVKGKGLSCSCVPSIPFCLSVYLGCKFRLNSKLNRMRDVNVPGPLSSTSEPWIARHIRAAATMDGFLGVRIGKMWGCWMRLRSKEMQIGMFLGARIKYPNVVGFYCWGSPSFS